MRKTYEYKMAKVREVACDIKMDCPQSAAEYWRTVITKQDWYQYNKEHLVVLLLDTRLNIKGHNLVSIGSLNESIAHPREILCPVICSSSYGFVLMHNHPSGQSDPSQADIKLTKRIDEGSTLLGLTFLDHVIMGDIYYSFKESGII